MVGTTYLEFLDDQLGQLGYTEENIQEIETEYEEYIINNTEIPDSIKNNTYTIIYPDGSS